MAYVKHTVEPREDLLGHLRHCAVVVQYGLLQHRGQGRADSRITTSCNTA
jgi:hypothetical protein